jgi:hypothetical protein
LSMPIALGAAIGVLVQLLGFVLVTVIVLGSTGPGDQLTGARVIGITAAGAGCLALACGLAARTCSRRGTSQRVDPRLVHRSAVSLGLILGCLALLIGLAPALRWTTLPVCLIAVAAGSAAGARTPR